jgi:hypothetical protein
MERINLGNLKMQFVSQRDEKNCYTKVTSKKHKKSNYILCEMDKICDI